MAGNITDQWFAAASVGKNYQTMQIWDGDGNAARVFEINFQGGYINQADVKAFMVNKTTQERTDLTVKFTGTNTLTLSAAVPTTHQVTIYRDTNKKAPLAAFADGAIITAINLDRNAKQAVFAVAEMVDRFDSVTATAQDAIATAYTAMSTANSAVTTANGAVTTANGAKTQAAAAVTTANAASTASSNAVTTANSANTAAAAAVATANGIDAKATKAMQDGAAAVATANGIDAKATKAMSDAAAAVTTANSASTTANGIDAKATKAQSDAAAAVTTANDAKSQIASASANFDKIWATITSIDTGSAVVWKGTHWFPGLELKSNTPFIDFHYGNSAADYTHRLIAENDTTLTASSSFKVNGNFFSNGTINGYGEMAVNGRAAFNNRVDMLSAYVSGNASPLNRQGMHLVWNESGDGKGSIVVNRGSGSGGLNLRFVDLTNSTSSGGVTFQPDGSIVTKDITASGGTIRASGDVWAGAAHLGTDGNIYGGTAFQPSLKGWLQSYPNMWQTMNGRVQGWTSINSNYLGIVVDGSAYGINMFASDADLKTNVVQASPDDALDDLCRIVLTEFDIKTFADAPATHQDYGFIAQQIEDIIPSAIFHVDGGYRQVNLMPLVAALIGSVQALNTRVKELESKQD